MYRNKKILELAKESPVCFWCGESNAGTVVACHSNEQRYGKGMGIKAHDHKIFYGCFKCHKIYDESDMTREEKERRFEQAHIKTIDWLFKASHLKVV